MISVINDVKISFDKKYILSIINKSLKSNCQSVIHTVNSNMLSVAYGDDEYKSILNNSVINICDGSVLAKILSLLSGQLLDPYPGPDFFIDLIQKGEYKFSFVGANPEINESLQLNLSKINPKISHMPFISLPYNEDPRSFRYDEISEVLNSYNSDIIWGSLGAPKQDYFAYYLLPYLKRGIVIPIGAAFNFYSDSVRRAPCVWRKYRLEWLYRLISEPRKTYKRLVVEISTMPHIIINELLKR